MKTGFIGLGHLGRAVAGRLIDCGHSLIVWNRNPEKTAGVNALVAESPAEVARQAEIIFLCLFDSNAVEQVLTGAMGLLAGEANGKIIIDLTTNHFRRTPDFHAMCARAGADYLECPVLGSVVPASQGNLTVLAGGDKAAYERAQPLLADIGKNLFFLGAPGLASKMKLINNLTLGSFMATLAEALSMGEAVGIDRKEVLDILSVGGGNSLVLNAKKNKLQEGDFSTHFSNALIYKDLHCLMDLAYDARKPLFTGALTKELFARACAEGLGDEDFSSIYKIFAQPGGIKKG